MKKHLMALLLVMTLIGSAALIYCSRTSDFVTTDHVNVGEMHDMWQYAFHVPPGTRCIVDERWTYIKQGAYKVIRCGNRVGKLTSDVGLEKCENRGSGQPASSS